MENINYWLCVGCLPDIQRIRKFVCWDYPCFKLLWLLFCIFMSIVDITYQMHTGPHFHVSINLDLSWCLNDTKMDTTNCSWIPVAVFRFPHWHIFRKTASSSIMNNSTACNPPNYLTHIITITQLLKTILPQRHQGLILQRLYELIIQILRKISNPNGLIMSRNLHTSKQLSCGMCKIMTWLNHHFSSKDYGGL